MNVMNNVMPQNIHLTKENKERYIYISPMLLKPWENEEIVLLNEGNTYEETLNYIFLLFNLKYFILCIQLHIT